MRGILQEKLYPVLTFVIIFDEEGFMFATVMEYWTPRLMSSAALRFQVLIYQRHRVRYAELSRQEVKNSRSTL